MAKQEAIEIKHPPQQQLDALVALYNQQRFADAAEQAEQLTVEYPNSFVLWNVFGAAYKALGNLQKAEQGFRRAADIDPKDPDAHNNLGVALKEQGKHEDAIAAYKRALAIKPDYAAAHYNMGNALKEQGKREDAIAAYKRTLAIKPDYADAHNNMGNALEEQGKREEAIAAYKRTLAIKPGHAAAHYNMGNALEEQGKREDAIAAYQRALAIKPNYEKAEAQLLNQQQHVCDFTAANKLSAASAHLGISTKSVSPFNGLPWVDNAEQQLLRSKTWASEKYKLTPLPLSARPQTRPKRLKVGYFSSDFRDHAAMYLMAGLLREHDSDQFEQFAYSYGRGKSGDWRKKVEGDVDHFFDVTGTSDREIAELARSHGLDIAVDLNGYTTHSRSDIFQYRLAPIQINYLGYPGSMGADFIDYMIADPIVVPVDQRQFYSEKVIYLPDTYQPNDDAREIAETNTARADFGLPEDGFVFCCFNNNYKISPREFAIWMRLLTKVDGSVLWLLKSNKWSEQNLRKEAEQRGVDPSRLIFAEKLSHSEHLARHKHADLFIDTFNYNAHTTTSDALWGGLPVVTKQGKQFAARVAASLLTAIGLPELITETEEDYEHLILELATQLERLAAIKGKLADNRLKEPLFDTKRYTRNFERGLHQAYDLYFDGQQPEDIWVTGSN